MGREPTRVVVVDDHQVVREGTRRLLEGAGIQVLGEAGTAGQTLRLIALNDPDVVVLDVRLPDGSGIELTSTIRKRFPSVRVLILTSYEHPELLEAAMEAGASGFVLKRIKGTELIDAVERVAAGETVVDPESAGSRSLTDEDRLISTLSEHQLEILEGLANGLTNLEIAERMFLSQKTIKNYVSNILHQLGMKRRSEAAALFARHRARQMARRSLTQG